jgi:hypothetical protein
MKARSARLPSEDAALSRKKHKAAAAQEKAKPKYDKVKRTKEAYDKALEIIRSKGYNPSDKSAGDTTKVIRYINNIMKAHDIKGFKNYGQMLKMLKAGVPAKKDRPSAMHTGKIRAKKPMSGDPQRESLDAQRATNANRGQK